jgi:glycerate 2-kinase
MSDRAFLATLFDAAVQAADPSVVLKNHLPPRSKGRLIVIGFGKGSARMAQAFEDLYGGPLEGLVVTRYGYEVPCKRIAVLEAAHPVPDAAGLAASHALMTLLTSAGPDDQIVALISGGGSALLPAPAKGLTLQDEVDLNQALLASGAPISVMNKIRSAFSRVKAGGLAGFAPLTPILNLVVSDVPGDDAAEVASGPTIPRPISRGEVLGLVQDWAIDLPDSLTQFLEATPQTAPAQDVSRITTRVIASARQSLEAAVRVAKKAGVRAVILSDRIEGEARDVGKVHAAIAAEIALHDQPFPKPVVLLSGGETTVTVKGEGKGGRNSEFALALALAAEGIAFTALAADTDGIDGSENNAGVFADQTTAARLRALGRDGRSYLADNDAFSAFDQLGDLFVTGPTGTNVNDFRAILVR